MPARRVDAGRLVSWRKTAKMLGSLLRSITAVPL
jgi:hypothetical protein